MNYQKTFYILARILTGILFIYSAWSKTLSIDDFELRIIQSNLISWSFVSFTASLIIFCEFFIGLYYLLIPVRSGFTEKLAIAFLTGFTIYLIIILYKVGNDVNCGCMGNEIPFTPLQAIIKNIITLVTVFLIQAQKNVFRSSGRLNRILLVSSAVLSLSACMLLLPLDSSFGSSYHEDMHEPFQYQIIENQGKYRKADFDFSEHAYTAAFLSMSCSHCKIAADKLSEIKKADERLKIVVILNGDSLSADSFLMAHGLSTIPYTMLFGENFVQMAGMSLPSIYLVKDSTIRKKINHRNISLQKLRNWQDLN